MQQYDSSTSSGIVPILVLVTSSGSIGSISTLDSKLSKILIDLERNLRHVLPGIGNLNQES